VRRCEKVFLRKAKVHYEDTQPTIFADWFFAYVEINRAKPREKKKKKKTLSPLN